MEKGAFGYTDFYLRESTSSESTSSESASADSTPPGSSENKPTLRTHSSKEEMLSYETFPESDFSSPTPPRSSAWPSRRPAPPSPPLGGTQEDLALFIDMHPELFADQEPFFDTLFGDPPTQGIWVLVDSERSQIMVMQDETPVVILPNISVGKGGVSYLKIQFDEKTPKGIFRIDAINENSQYHRFFRFNYPTLAHLEYAYDKKLLPVEEYHRLLRYYRRYHYFPQDTRLGGHLGIHGIGDADNDLHQRFNWTRGCVALTNQQVDILSHYLKVGTVVMVK
jgi:hypothetical protein